MNIRLYNKEDWKDVVNIYNLSKPDELRGSVNLQALIPLEDDKNSIKQFHESEILVAEVNNQIAGFGGNKGNCISWLFVHPNYRRKGVAQLILNQILETLEGTVKLNVAKNNLAAKTLYTKLGFIVEREFEGNYNGYKSQAMTLSLSKSS